MLVRVIITNTPLSRRMVRLMIKMTVISALMYFFGVVSLAAVFTFYGITKLLSRRNTPQFSYKKSRPLKKKAS